MTRFARLNELWDAEIDASMPINRFARKACTLLNKLKRGTACSGEYGDGSARIYLNTALDTKLIAKFDKEVRKLAANHKELKALDLPVVDIFIHSYEIRINFS